MGLNDLVCRQTNLTAPQVTGSQYHQSVNDVPRVGGEERRKTDSPERETVATNQIPTCNASAQRTATTLSQWEESPAAKARSRRFVT